MREYLRRYVMYGQAVIINTEIVKFGDFNFDGSKNLIPLSNAEILISPISFDHPKAKDFLNLPLCFETKTTLLRPVSIEDQPEYIFDESDHFWFPGDLSQYGYHKGSNLQIMGRVATYKRKDGSVDFCLQPDNVMVHR